MLSLVSILFLSLYATHCSKDQHFLANHSIEILGKIYFKVWKPKNFVEGFVSLITLCRGPAALSDGPCNKTLGLKESVVSILWVWHYLTGKRTVSLWHSRLLPKTESVDNPPETCGETANGVKLPEIKHPILLIIALVVLLPMYPMIPQISILKYWFIVI